MSFLTWAEAYAAGPAVVGGKAWNLARLDRYGFPVPAGGVLPVGDPVSEDTVAALEAAGLLAVPVAVRSSAVAEDGSAASFAGIHDSVLNVMGRDAVLEAIRHCLASGRSERAIAYRRRMGVPDGGGALAVVVMRMASAVSAGVAFSCDPASGRQDRVMIAANFGLGESVVGGACRPDELLVDVGFHAIGYRVVERRAGDKAVRVVARPEGGTERLELAPDATPVLDDAQAVDLARLVMRVRQALGHDEHDQDVEWVWDGSRFLLTQARPVTARRRRTYPEIAAQTEIWSNGNVRDALPLVLTPLTWSIMASALHTLLTAQFRASGWPYLPGLTRARLVEGRVYLDVSIMQWEYWVAMGTPPAGVNEFLGGHQPCLELPPAKEGKLSLLARTLRFMGALRRARKRADAIFAEVEAACRADLARDRAAWGDAALVADLTALGSFLDRMLDLQVLLLSGGATLWLLRPLIERFAPGRGAALGHALLAGENAITSAEHGRALQRIAALAAADPAARAVLAEPDPQAWRGLPADSPFRRALEDFLERWGHRAVYELEWAHPRWREDPSWLVETVRQALDLPERQARPPAEAAWAELRARLPRPLLPLVRWLVREAARDAAQREEAKSAFVRLNEPGRATAREIGRRLAERGLLESRDDVFLLGWEEVFLLLQGGWSGAGARALVADRRVRLAELAARPAPDLILDGRPAIAAAAADGAALRGLGVAAGRARGPARILRHPGEGARLQPGDVLVAPSTDPAWTPLFLRASALIMETGGLISHGAIVAREYGLPAVVNVPGALDRIADGAMVTVDGDRGEVAVED